MGHYNRNAGKINLAVGAAPADSARAPRPGVTLLGCDVGGTNVKVVRVRAGRIERSSEFPTRAGGPASALVSDLAGAIGSLLPDFRSARGHTRVGVALPGFLDEARETVLRLSNVPVLDGVRLRRRLEHRLGRPVVLDTDTNAGAVAESLLGAGRGFERVLYVTLGTGLGVALVVGGRPVRVSRHTVGQAAHIPLHHAPLHHAPLDQAPVQSSHLRPRGLRCRCGERGCAEAELSAGGILLRARGRGLRGLRSTRDLADLARKRGAGPPATARAVWRETGEILGRLCVILGAFLAPDAIVVGGGVAAAANRFLTAARREVRGHLTPRMGRAVAVRPAELGRLAGAVGAALLAAGGR